MAYHKTNMSGMDRRAHGGMFSQPLLPAQVVFAGIAALIAAAAVWIAATAYGSLPDALHEDGPVEKASAVLWGVSVLIALYFLPLHRLGALWHLPAAFAFLAARELDFDKRFLSEGILQIRLYTGDAPVWEKAIGLAVIAAILITFTRLLRRGGPQFLGALKAGGGWAWCSAASVVLAVTSKTLDGLERKLAGFGIEVGPAAAEWALVAEELMELGCAAMVVWAICLGASRLRTAGQGGALPARG